MNTTSAGLTVPAALFAASAALRLSTPPVTLARSAGDLASQHVLHRLDRTYYTLAARRPGERWTAEFGSYERSVTHAEMTEYRNVDRFSGEYREYRLVTSGDTKAQIADAIAALNAGVK